MSAMNICFWIGEAPELAISSLSDQGFDVQILDWSDKSFAKVQKAEFVVLVSASTPTQREADYCKNYNTETQFILVWTDEEFETAWYETGVDNVFVGKASRFKNHAGFVTKLICERRKQSELAEKNAKTADHLQVTVESLEVASKRFEALFNGLPVACFTFDSAGMIHEWNALSTEVFGIEAYEAFYNTVWDTLDPELRGFWLPEVVAQIFENSQSHGFDWTYIKPDGSEMHLACKVLRLTNRSGEVIAAVAGNLDITERVLAQRKVDEQVREIKSYLKVMEKQRIKLQDANRQLRLLAVTDGLTGLMNRRRFNEQLDETIDRAIRQNGSFSLLLFDIDHFKQLNDVFGHQAGDEILIKFAGVLKEAARRYERPARYGGEEFAIILDNCDAPAGIMAAERFRSAILATDWPHREITASVGVSTFSGTETARNMIENADAGLYASKRNGRNQVTHFDKIQKSDQVA
jgi:diguanylate cyclase (GGDEF)-like protein/PAS domain S-box-containing protein